jgi:hypothetical protein
MKGVDRWNTSGQKRWWWMALAHVIHGDHSRRDESMTAQTTGGHCE